jgi:iron complex outermembrane receptor protein
LRGGIDQEHGGALDVWYQKTVLLPNSCFADTSNLFGGPAPNANTVRQTYCSNNIGLDDREIKDASFTTTYRMPFATLTNVLGWEKTTEYFNSDQDPYTASRNEEGFDGTQSQWYTDTSWEDELRLTSTSDWRVKWMLGGYFLDTRDILTAVTGIDEGKGIARVSTSPLYGYAPNPTTSFFANADHNQDFAIFAHASYDILPKLTLEAGFRYDWDNLNQFIFPDSSAGVPAGCTFGNGANCRRSRWFPEGQPKVTLTYALTSHINVFTDYGVGFRSGQFNQAGTAEAVHLPGAYDVVNPEVAHTWEVGFKSQWLDNRLTVNGSFFDSDDQNSFFFLFAAAVDAQILVNINDVRLVGGNLEVNYTPVDNLDLFGNIGYTHSNITSYAFDPADRGNWAPLVPLFTADVGAQYTFPLIDGLQGFARGDLEITGKEYWDPENTTPRNELNLINLQAGLIGPNDRWRLVGWVKNLGNVAYNEEYDSYGFAYAAEPRTFGVDLKFKY